LGHSLAAREVTRIPCESIADRLPVHSQPIRDLTLTDLPAVALDELDHADLPTSGDGAQQVFEPAQAARRLGQPGLSLPRGAHGRVIEGRDFEHSGYVRGL
jgi:hypothetical protein